MRAATPLPIDGGEAQKLTDFPLGVFDPKWFPDGRRVAFGAPVLTGEAPSPPPGAPPLTPAIPAAPARADAPGRPGAGPPAAPQGAPPARDADTRASGPAGPHSCRRLVRSR